MFSIHTMFLGVHDNTTVTFNILQVFKNGLSSYMVPDEILSRVSAIFGYVVTINILSIKLQQVGNEFLILSVKIFSFLCLEKVNLKRHLDHTFRRV